jgi:DNA (cytosine-5)-methyltransferase 1
MLKVVSLFSGCGGSDLGMVGDFKYLGKKYKKLPYEIVFANDNDAKAVATYNENFDHPAVLGSILDLHDQVPNHDILIGGFPCQSFSSVNPTKDPNDDRAQLYKEMARILKEKQPMAFIGENVKGLVVLKKGAFFKKITKEFSDAGYTLKHLVVNTADYGVPQKRQRVFIVGIRNDLKVDFSFPEATHSELPEKSRKQWVPISKVIDSLVPEDPKYYFSERAVLGMKNAKNNMKRGLAQSLDAPSLTLTSHLAKVSLNSRDPVLMVDESKELYRRFTPLEAARIQSFPDDFRFAGSDANAYRQIGNAIAPVMMWHIANRLAEVLEPVVATSEEKVPEKKVPEKKESIKLNLNYGLQSS